MKKRYLILALVFIINMLFISCKANNGSIVTSSDALDDISNGTPHKGGVVKLFTTTPDTLNPILTNNIYVQDFSNLIFEGLVRMDKAQKPVPVLADKWDVSSDGLIWTFHLRANVFWHNGKPFTSEDVEFTLNCIKDPKVNSVYKTNIQNIASYTAIDSTSIRIILNKPNSYTAEALTFPIISKDYFNGEDIITSPKNMAPIGTGPYRFIEYNIRNNIKLTANGKWWNSKNEDNKAPDLPYIPEVDIRIYENGKDSINAFQTRDVDVVTLKTEDCKKYRGRSDLIIKKFPNSHYEFVAFNLSNTILSDKAVRQAIAYAVDKTKVVGSVLPGEAIASDLPIMPGTWLYDSNIISYSPSLSKAREILEQNGWKENNGLLYKNINGSVLPLSLEILVNDDNEVRLKVAQNLSEQLKEIGIELKVNALSYNKQFNQIKSQKYDMALTGMTVSSVPDLSYLYSSSEIGGFNIARYDNVLVSDYINQMLTETDNARKKALFLNARDIISDEVPYLGLYFYYDAVVYNKKLRGELTPSVWNEYDNIVKWYMMPDPTQKDE